MGTKLGYALFEYVMIKEDDQKLREIRIMQQLKKNSKRKVTIGDKGSIKIDKKKLKKLLKKAKVFEEDKVKDLKILASDE